jgi:hypothetical protein
MLSHGPYAMRPAAVAVFVFGMSVAPVLAQAVATDAPLSGEDDGHPYMAPPRWTMS